MGQKLRFVRGHINADGAIALAAFAGETQVERLLHVLVTPAILDDIFLSHLPEEMRPSTRGMLLLTRHAKARTHDAAFIAAALTHSNATQCGVRQTTVVFRKLKMGRRLPGIVVSAEAQ